MSFQAPPSPFASAAPEVQLISATPHPFDNAVAAARVCYSSKGIVTPEDVARNPEQRDRIARLTYKAGHHTTLQHAHLQFALSNVSRHLLWSFLHAHPFYNSEQVSQRYVEVKPSTAAVPALGGRAQSVYEAALGAQLAAYRRLIDLLTPPTAREYYRIFPARRKDAQYEREVKKRAQEIARYVLPVSTFAYLFHTVSALTLLRLWRLSNQPGAGAEAAHVVGRMVEELLRHDPLFETILEAPIPAEDTIEARALGVRRDDETVTQTFLDEFDRSLDGRASRLVDHLTKGPATIAAAVREVLGLPTAALPDAQALALVLDPAQNTYHGEALTLTTQSPLSRALHHAGYTFRKRLSHTADSQDQRHRMTPASRPILAAHLTGEPDYVTPELVRRHAAARVVYDEAMARTWEAIRALEALGVSAEWRAYLLPNAVTVRCTESADLIHLHPKLRSRLCYNAQEEIWRASLEEARQILDVNPEIGRWLLPPCGLRLAAGKRPVCPEGERFCGVPVWRLTLDQYARII